MSPNRKIKLYRYTVYAEIDQLEVNNIKVLCHLPMKLSDMFDQNPPQWNFCSVLLAKIVGLILVKYDNVKKL